MLSSPKQVTHSRGKDVAERAVLMPLLQPRLRPTETGVPWQILTAAPGVEVEFATPNGEPGEARWPGDAFTFGKRFLALLKATRPDPASRPPWTSSAS